MRLNNLSARLVANKKLIEAGLDPIDASLDYTQFATKLRQKTAKTVVQVPFVVRADAVKYIRDFARQCLTHPE